jgi:hypothetical protein
MGKLKRNSGNTIRHQMFNCFATTQAASELKTEPVAHPLDNINKRIAAIKLTDMECFTSPLPVEDVLNLESIKADSHLSQIHPMIEIRDFGPLLNTPTELKEARDFFYGQAYTPVIWRTYLQTGQHTPFLLKKTSFINLFNHDTVVMVDMYRPPWKPYFTSDIFFDQWLRATGAGANLFDLPKRFPSILYIHNITNLISKSKMKSILDKQESDIAIINCDEPREWAALLKIPHLKCITHILRNYNEINNLRGGNLFNISSIQLYRQREMYHLKLKIQVESDLN